MIRFLKCLKIFKKCTTQIFVIKHTFRKMFKVIRIRDSSFIEAFFFALFIKRHSAIFKPVASRAYLVTWVLILGLKLRIMTPLWRLSGSPIITTKFYFAQNAWNWCPERSGKFGGPTSFCLWAIEERVQEGVIDPPHWPPHINYFNHVR